MIWLSNINLSKNELQNAVIHKLASAPGSPSEGQLYYNTSDQHLYFRQNAAWHDVTNALTLGGTAAASYALLASPTFTGTPAAPTASVGTNTTQLATTAFVVAEIASRLATADALRYMGAIDASTNPNYPAGNAGDTYRISVAGKIGGASGPNVEVGDMIILHVDGSAGGTHAAVGADWDIIQTNIDGGATADNTLTFTNKTINLSNNTLSGTIAQFNTALSDGDFATLAGTETLSGKTLTTPTIASFTNATHDHEDAAGGGQLAEAALNLTDVTTNNATTARHGFLPKLSNNSAQFLDGTGAWSTPGGGGTVNKYAVNVGNASDTEFTITHNLNSRDVTVTIREVGSPYAMVMTDVEMATVNTVVVRFAVAPSTDQYRVIVTG